MALTAKQEAFARACAKGGKASDAYRAAYDARKMVAKTVHEKASRLLAQGKIRARIAELREPAVHAVRLEIEDTLRQVIRINRSDPRKLFNPDGTLKAIHELDDDTAAAIASVEVGHDGKGKPSSRKVRFWDKNAALNMAMRHLGMFEKDNAQLAENIQVQVVLVQPKPIEGPL